MFEHNGISYYSEQEIKKKDDEFQREYKRRQKVYKNIRILLLILLVCSLAGNIHLYLKEYTTNELLYVCNAEKILIQDEEQVKSDRSISNEERQKKEKKLKEKREKIEKKAKDALYQKNAGDIVMELQKKSDKIDKELELESKNVEVEITEIIKDKK